MAFSDIAPLAEQCRFSDCAHQAEPGCALRTAVATGSVSGERVDSYLKLRQEIAAAQARRDPVQGGNSKRRWKTIHKEKRRLSKSEGKKRG